MKKQKENVKMTENEWNKIVFRTQPNKGNVKMEKDIIEFDIERLSDVGRLSTLSDLVITTMESLIHSAPTKEIRSFLLNELLEFNSDVSVKLVREKMREEISDEFMAKAAEEEASRKKRSEAAKKYHAKKRRAARKDESEQS